MKEFEIVVNEETEIISVNDFFTFSIERHIIFKKYYRDFI